MSGFASPHCTFWMLRSKNTCWQRQSSALCLQWSVFGKLPSVLCCEASVVACLHASDWARVQTQSVVVLWWDHKRWGHSLWLLCLSFAMLCCMFLVLFTAFLTTWPRVDWATFGLGLMGENCNTINEIYTRKDCSLYCTISQLGQWKRMLRLYVSAYHGHVKCQCFHANIWLSEKITFYTGYQSGLDIYFFVHQPLWLVVFQSY